MLYNFHDSPADLYERMVLNIDLNEELGIRIWSFPMRYQPTDRPDRTFVGEKWSRYQIEVITDNSSGDARRRKWRARILGTLLRGAGEFQNLLLRPHHFIFNRDWYEVGPGRGELEEFKVAFSDLSEAQHMELCSLLSGVDPVGFRRIGEFTSDNKVRLILPYYFARRARSREKFGDRRRAMNSEKDLRPKR